MNVTTPVLLIVFFFIMIPLVLAEFVRARSVPSAEDFFLQNRKMPIIMSFFTIYATWMSIFGLMGACSYFYGKGPIYMTSVAWDIFFGILVYLIGTRIWFYGKQRGYFTPTDFFNDIYGSRKLNIAITVIIIFFTVPYLEIQFSGSSYLVEIATNGLIPWQISGLLFYSIIVIYLWYGGLRAVALADVFYGACLLATMLFTGFYLSDKAGGVHEMFKLIENSGPKHLTLPGPNNDAGAFFWICMFLTVPIGALMGPQMWIRNYAVKSYKTFKIVPLLLALVGIQVLGPMLAGSAGIILEPNVTVEDKLIPILFVHYSGSILCGFIFCGVASAALSTANSQIHAIATVYTIDIHRRYINPDVSDRKMSAIARWTVLTVSFITFGIFLKTPTVIMETGIMALGGVAQIFIPVLGALFWTRSNSDGAFWGLISGEAAIMISVWIFKLDSSYAAIIGMLINAVIFIMISLIKKPNPAVSEKILSYRNEYSMRVYENRLD